MIPVPISEPVNDNWVAEYSVESRTSWWNALSEVDHVYFSAGMTLSNTSPNVPILASFLNKGNASDPHVLIGTGPGGFYYTESPVTDVDESFEAPLTKVKEIKSSFGFNLSQLAIVLGASRPQLYKWLNGEVSPQREETNRKIWELHNFLTRIPANEVQHFGQLGKLYVSQDKTLMDTLSDGNLDEEMLMRAYYAVKPDIDRLENVAKSSFKDAGADVLLPPKG